MKVVVVGGGISGLATANGLLAAGIDVTLLEGAPTLGGNIRTVRHDGFVVDEGPDSWVAQKPQVAALCKALGLGDRLVETLPENRRVFVKKGTGLVPLPDGLVLGIPTRLAPLIATPLVSWPGKLRAALDLIAPPGFLRANADEDESVAAFIERRLGREVLDRLAGPLLGGLFSGNVDELSLLGTFPQLAALEHQGGLVRGALAQARKHGGGNKGPKPSPFLSLRGGMGELVDALAARLGKVARVGAPVTALERDGARFLVRHEAGEPIAADHVVLTGPTASAGRLVRGVAAPLAEQLEQIPTGSACTAFLGWDASDVPHPLDATGYLVPRGEGSHGAMATTFVSSKWPDRAPAGQVLLRVFFGAEHVERSDEDLVGRARAELGEALDVRKEPRFSHIARFRTGSPQPRVGHPARLREIDAILATNPGLYLVGSAYEGVGMGDCVRRADSTVAAILNG